MQRTIIVAYNQRLVIGNNLGRVPWHIPDDLKFFKDTTWGHPCVMGRKTWESIPEKYRPLPGRMNIVVSREYESKVEDQVAMMGTVEDALEFAASLDEEIFITGGGQIYNYCLDEHLVDRVLASEIKNYLHVDGATYFANLKARGWQGKVLKQYPEFDVVEYRI